MTVLVVGASERALRHIRQIAPASVSITVEAAEPDWMVVATFEQRCDAVRSRGLDAFRVLEYPEIASDLDSSAADALRAALVKMGGIGASRELLSPTGVRLVKPFVRRRVSSEAASGVPATFDDVATTRTALKGIPSRLPTGVRLDDLLASRARQRVERFVAQAVRWVDERSS